MATNYTFSEVVAIIKEGKDSAAIADIGKRFPLLAVKLAKATSGDVDAMVEVCGYIPAKVSANKVNMAIKAALGDAEEAEEAEDDEVEADVPEEVEEEKPKTKRAGKKAAPKKEEKTEEDDEEVEDDEEEADPYDGKDAVELYKMCKSRGIAVKPRRTAKFYAEALRKADAAAADEDEEDDDVEEELPKPTKKAKATKTAKPAKSAKKAKPEPVEEDDEDDEDWDI